jgi:hypothetical protein
MAGTYSPQIPTRGLIFYLDAGNPKSYSGTGTRWTDMSGNGWHGTLQGTPTFTAAGGQSYFTLNGSTQYITTANTTVYGTACTAALWVYANSSQVNSQPTLISKNSANAITMSDFPFRLGVTTDAKVYTGVDTGVDFVGFSTTSTAHNSANNWAHYVATFSQTALRMYVNGSLIASTTYSTTTVPSNAQPWTIGRAAQEVGLSAGALTYLTGRIATASLYNSTLSADEVLQNFNATRGRFGV